MTEREQLQKEALEELIEYSKKLIPALEMMIVELREDIKDDTEEILNDIIIGINWEIEVYNQCASLLNKGENGIDKKEMIQAVKNLGTALGSGEQMDVANCFEKEFLPFLNKLSDLAQQAVA